MLILPDTITRDDFATNDFKKHVLNFDINTKSFKNVNL